MFGRCGTTGNDFTEVFIYERRNNHAGHPMRVTQKSCEYLDAVFLSRKDKHPRDPLELPRIFPMPDVLKVHEAWRASCAPSSDPFLLRQPHVIIASSFETGQMEAQERVTSRSCPQSMTLGT